MDRKSFDTAFEQNTMYEIEKVTLRLIESCNLKCKKCDCWYNKKNKYWSIENIKKIIDQLIVLDAKKICFSGGEVTLHPNLLDIISYCSSVGLKSSIITNGYNLDKNYIDDIINAGIRQVSISLDSHSSKVHDKMVGIEGAWVKTTDTIKNFIQSIKNKPKVRIIVNCVIFKENINSLDKFVQYVAMLGVSEVRFLWLHDYHLSDKSMKVNAEEIRKFNSEIIPKILLINTTTTFNSCNRYFIEDQNFTDFSTDPKYYYETYKKIPCFVPWFRLHINLKGDLFPCCHISDDYAFFGNVKEKPINELINNEKYKAFRAMCKPPINILQCRCCMDKIDYNFDKLHEINSSKLC